MTPKFVNVLGDMLTDHLELMSRSQIAERHGRRAPYTINELRVMSLVYRRWRRNELCNMASLVQETGINKATVSRAVTTLFGYGLVTERFDPDDRRIRYIHPSEEGKRDMERVAEWLESWAEQIFAIAQDEIVAGTAH